MPEQQRASNNANTWTLGRETRGVENPGGWHLCHTHTFRTATTDKTGKFPPLCCYMFFSSDSSKPSPSQLESRINDDDNSEIFPAPKRKKNWWAKEKSWNKKWKFAYKNPKVARKLYANFASAHLDAGGVAAADRRFGQKADIEKRENP